MLDMRLCLKYIVPVSAKKSTSFSEKLRLRRVSSFVFEWGDPREIPKMDMTLAKRLLPDFVNNIKNHAVFFFIHLTRF